MPFAPKTAQNEAKMENVTSTSDSEKKPQNTPSVGVSDKELEKLSQLTFAKLEQGHALLNEHDVLKKATKLVRCIITCNDRTKTALPGEIFSVRNANIPEQKKYIPFNVPTHVPQIILNAIREKNYTHFKKVRLPIGIESTKAEYLPAYNIQILPPLTSEEYNAIRQKQLAEGQYNA